MCFVVFFSPFLLSHASFASIDFQFFLRLVFFNKWYFSSMKFPHQRITRLCCVCLACLNWISFSLFSHSFVSSPLPFSSSSIQISLYLYLDFMKIRQLTKWTRCWGENVFTFKLTVFYTRTKKKSNSDKKKCSLSHRTPMPMNNKNNSKIILKTRKKNLRSCRSSNKFVKLSIYNVNEYEVFKLNTRRVYKNARTQDDDEKENEMSLAHHVHKNTHHHTDKNIPIIWFSAIFFTHTSTTCKVTEERNSTSDSSQVSHSAEKKRKNDK